MVTQIKGNNGSYLTNDSDILEECNSFYGSLYTSRNSTAITEKLRKFGFRQELPKLDNDEEQKCEGLLTEKKIGLEAVKLMAPGKLPGTGTTFQRNFTRYFATISLHTSLAL